MLTSPSRKTIGTKEITHVRAVAMLQKFGAVVNRSIYNLLKFQFDGLFARSVDQTLLSV
jgi:hypothetical protein